MREGSQENLQASLSVYESKVEAALVYMEQAEEYDQEGRWAEAIAVCQQALKIAPDLAVAYKLWGKILQEQGKNSEAIGCYAKALEIDPEYVEVYANLGSMYAGKQEWGKSISYYQRAIALNPKFAGAYRNLAKVYKLIGKNEQAATCILNLYKVLQEGSEQQSPEDYINLGAEMQSLGKIEEAIACYHRALELNPKLLEISMKLGDLLSQLGHWQEATSYYRHSLAVLGKKPLPPLRGKMPLLKGVEGLKQLSPQAEAVAVKQPLEENLEGENTATAYAEKGAKHAAAAAWEKAIAAYEKAVSLNPNWEEPYRNLGMIYGKLGKIETAAEYWYKALTIKPKIATSKQHFKLGNSLLQQGKTDWALNCYRNSIQLEPDFSLAYIRIGEILKRQGKMSEAISCWLEGIKQNPQIASLHYNLGQGLAEQSKWSAAISCYQKAISLEPNNWEIYQQLGDACQKQEQYSEAVNAYKKAIELNQENSWNYNNLGDVLLKLKQWEEAIRAYQQAIELNPDFFWSYQNMGDALRNVQDWDGAIGAYQKAIKLNGDFPWSYYNLGEVFAKLGSWEEAITAYKAAVELKADFAEAYGHLGDALARQGKWSDAIVYYEKAIDIDPAIHVSVYKNLGEALERKKYLTANQNPTKTTENRQWPEVGEAALSPPPTMPDGTPWPKISIVTPSYNQGKFIEETILSVIHQNYPHLEYILIDGGSTDETMTIVEKYRSHFKLVISEPDQGQSNALNKGFSQATGDILAWVNSDDLLAPGALRAVALAFYTSKADVVAGVCKIFQDGREIEQHLTSLPSGVMPLDELLDVENNWLNGKFFYQPEVMFTRAIWEKAGGKLDESLFYSMDYELWARLAANGARIEVIGYPVAQYRMHPNQKTSTMEKYRPELLKVRDKLQVRFNRPTKEKKAGERRSSLKVLFFNDTGELGGAGIAHHRIAQAFALAGHQVITVAGTLDWSYTPVDSRPLEIYEAIASVKPDLVVVGNIHNLKYPLEILEMLATKFPTIFVMHDQWLLTGRCAYVGNCTKYTSLCDAECPTSQEYPRLEPMKIAPAFNYKQSLIKECENLLVFGDSKWVTNWAKENYRTHSPGKNPELKFQPIYYGIEREIFQPRDKAKCRRQLGLSADKFIILTGSQSLNDQRKGMKYLLEGLENIEIENLLLVSFGHGTQTPGRFEWQSTGYLDHPLMLAYYYSAADLFVGPSLEEAFGQTFIEAAACGTPAIGYAVGGVTEAIANGITGQIVAEKTPAALAKVIMDLYQNRDKLELLSRTAPIYIANKFSLQSSYQSCLVALDKSGLLDKLRLIPASKFRPILPEVKNKKIIVGQETKNKTTVIEGRGIKGYTLEGFGELEPPYPDLGILSPTQWLLGLGGKFAIVADEEKKGQLVISCRNMSQEQFLEIWHDEKVLLRGLVPNCTIDKPNVFTVPISLAKGLNILVIKADKYIEYQEQKPLAIMLERMTLVEEQANEENAVAATSWTPKSPRVLDELSISMDGNIQGTGWFPAENFNGTQVRWMKQQGSIMVDGITTAKNVQLKILGITASDPQFIKEMGVKVNGKELEGSVKSMHNGFWIFAGIMPGQNSRTGLMIEIETPGVKQLAPDDLRLASLLVKEIILKVQE
ncbi:MAG: tetratricopeptide repeat protein [Gomphosphaeria aponina SAG 52.96 = DSM 107014]|uniref:Tetratricopeptide repeat protein n=1 Tax=Gomphosphaeria aponina SAG 52.96 = DSM 107014 TaxID=1521640 RepID=A0A941GNT5_9CHRO|nr:tetratricopeptide repeat protein [Gomphosphaeria aponina SAG 52.96 = DSM 107014]